MDNLEQFLIIDKSQESLRLDKLLALYFDQSRTYFQYLIDQQAVVVNGQSAKKSTKLFLGDEIEVQFILTKEIALDPENIPLHILFEDDHFLAINKPAGLVVHPGPGNQTGTFVHALLYHCKTLEQNNSIRPGIVHRLDKDTTGVLIAAKHIEAHHGLAALFASRKIEKRYLGISVGSPNTNLIDAPLGRHPTMRKLMTVREGGKLARTHIQVLSKNQTLSLLDITLETGRTHQIRAHLKHIGHPLLGDPVYGASRMNRQHGIYRQMLHAASLSFVHPITGILVEIKADLAEDMQKIVNLI